MGLLSGLQDSVPAQGVCRQERTENCPLHQAMQNCEMLFRNPQDCMLLAPLVAVVGGGKP